MKKDLWPALVMAGLGVLGFVSLGSAEDKKDTKTVTTDSGLKYIDTKVGDGDAAKAGDKVVVHYTGWLTTDGRTKGKKFDSSVDRNEPFSFPLGAGRVIKGWDEGVAGMKVGGKRTLIIPSELGYGKTGAGERHSAECDAALRRRIAGNQVNPRRAGSVSDRRWFRRLQPSPVAYAPGSPTLGTDPCPRSCSTAKRWPRRCRRRSPWKRPPSPRRTASGPGLAAVLVGDNPQSQSYVKSKQKACEKAGIASWLHPLPAYTSQADLLALIARLNADPAVHGILVQLPLPPHIDEAAVVDAVSPHKDVDGFGPESLGLLAAGRPRFLACTPYGVQQLLVRNGIPLAGAHVVVIGRSNIVGRPLSLILSQKGVDATVTLCHSRSRDVAALTRTADIVVAAIGKLHYLRPDMVRPGAVVVDVGMNRTPDGRWAGDADFDGAATDRRGDHARAGRRRADDHHHAAAQHGSGGDNATGTVRAVFRRSAAPPEQPDGQAGQQLTPLQFSERGTDANSSPKYEWTPFTPFALLRRAQMRRRLPILLLVSVALGTTAFNASTGFYQAALSPAGGVELATLKGDDGRVFSVTFSPNGKMLATGGTDGAVKLWDVASRKNTATLQGHEHWVLCVTFSPDGKTLASASADGTVKLWDVASGKNTSTINDHGVHSVSFSPDGKVLASASLFKTVKVWDVASGKIITTLEGHTHWVYSATFSPDGKTLASASADKTVRLWDVASGKNTFTLQGLRGMCMPPHSARTARPSLPRAATGR